MFSEIILELYVALTGNSMYGPDARRFPLSSNMSALIVGVKAEVNKKSATTNAKAKVIPFIVSRCS